MGVQVTTSIKLTEIMLGVKIRTSIISTERMLGVQGRTLIRLTKRLLDVQVTTLIIHLECYLGITWCVIIAKLVAENIVNFTSHYLIIISFNVTELHNTKCEKEFNWLFTVLFFDISIFLNEPTSPSSYANIIRYKYYDTAICLISKLCCQKCMYKTCTLFILHTVQSFWNPLAASALLWII